MIVERREFIAKPGRNDEMYQQVRSLFAEHPWPGTVRLYRSKIGQFNRVVVEMESEHLTAYEEIWDRWTSVAFTEENHKEWIALEDTGASNEFWEFEEMRAGD